MTPTSTAYETGTLAGAGSFECEECGFAVALQESDELPECPRCEGSRFKRSAMFGAPSTPAPPADDPAPEWLEQAREALVAPGCHLAFEMDDRVHVVPLQEGWTRVGRSLAAHIRLDDPTVSRRHALVHREGERVKVLDDRSLNGVFHNGERIEMGDVADRDVISIGRFALHVVLSA
jgi:FHA domain-containing protein/zinc ribbon family protein